MNTKNLPAFLTFGLMLLGLWVLAFWIYRAEFASVPGGYSVDHLYNQGNAYAHSGKTGLAVLNYERALVMAPGDADARANLHWVRDRAGLPDSASNIVTRAVTSLSPNALALAGSVGLLLTGLGFLLASFGPQGRWTSASAAVVGVLLIGLTITSAVLTAPKLSEAVVTADAAARISPVTTGDVSFKLREGEIVSVEAQYHDFALIRTGTAQSGWILASELSRVIPAQETRTL